MTIEWLGTKNTIMDCILRLTASLMHFTRSVTYQVLLATCITYLSLPTAPWMVPVISRPLFSANQSNDTPDESHFLIRRSKNAKEQYSLCFCLWTNAVPFSKVMNPGVDRRSSWLLPNSTRLGLYCHVCTLPFRIPSQVSNRSPMIGKLALYILLCLS